jgi:hypothetical protein
MKPFFELLKSRRTKRKLVAGRWLSSGLIERSGANIFSLRVIASGYNVGQ